MKKKIVSLLFACTLAISGIAHAEEYIMCPGDQLDITVLGHEDISTVITTPGGKYIVRPDGKLSFPLIGEVDITGLTIAQFTKNLEQRLSEYLVDPKITVNIAQLGTTRVYVLGEVNKPGLYELNKSHKLLDAIGDVSLAGAPIRGHFTGYCTGHAMNNKLLHALFADESAWTMADVGAMDHLGV